MALPTSSDLQKLNIAYLGEPFCDVPSKPSIDLSKMDIAYLGEPFVRNAGVASSVTLTVAKMSVAVEIDNRALTQKHLLVVQEQTCSVAVDNVVLAQKHLLIVNDLTCGVVSEAIVLTQKHSLTVNELTCSVAADSPSLTQKQLLKLDDMTCGVTVDGLSLTQKHLISVSKVWVAVTETAVALSQKHNLTVNRLAVTTLNGGAARLVEDTMLVVADVFANTAVEGATVNISHATLRVSKIKAATANSGVALFQKYILQTDDIVIGTSPPPKYLMDLDGNLYEVQSYARAEILRL